MDRKYKLTWGVDESQTFTDWVNAAAWVKMLLEQGYSEITVSYG